VGAARGRIYEARLAGEPHCTGTMTLSVPCDVRCRTHLSRRAIPRYLTTLTVSRNPFRSRRNSP